MMTKNAGNFSTNSSNLVSIVDVVTNIIIQAIQNNSSDIHFESTESNLRVRYRIDGILYDKHAIDKERSSQIISRIKVLSNIDIAQCRMPQDGKFKFFFENNPIDLRVSTFPSIYGEKVVIRILDKIKTDININNLGFNSEVLNKFKKIINKNSGFILTAGPTGSGKTTTLYAALHEIYSTQKNIITLEDPIEYHIDGITQGQINNNAGFTFAKGIKSLLRQDPDIVMIGEIRDIESAKIAIEAALTGHLVFSTIHTIDSTSTIIRLMDMQIEPYLINASITGILSQRLVRKICNQCRVSINISDPQKKILDSYNLKKINSVYKGQGCNNCFGLGYKGRTGIFELLIMTEELKSLIIKNPKYQEIRLQAVQDEMQTLFDDAIDKINSGIITLEEFIRVIA